MRPSATSLVVLLLVAGCGHSLARETVAPSASGSPTPTPVQSPARTPTASVTTNATAGATRAATATPPATARPSSSTPAPSGTVVVSDGDTGTTVHLHSGELLDVRLTKDSYDPPTSSDNAVVVRRSSHGGYPSTDPVDAVFEAQAAGTADVSATSDYACFHTSPKCYIPTRLWVVHVVVS